MRRNWITRINRDTMTGKAVALIMTAVLVVTMFITHTDAVPVQADNPYYGNAYVYRYTRIKKNSDLGMDVDAMLMFADYKGEVYVPYGITTKEGYLIWAYKNVKEFPGFSTDDQFDSRTDVHFSLQTTQNYATDEQDRAVYVTNIWDTSKTAYYAISWVDNGFKFNTKFKVEGKLVWKNDEVFIYYQAYNLGYMLNARAYGGVGFTNPWSDSDYGNNLKKARLNNPRGQDIMELFRLYKVEAAPYAAINRNYTVSNMLTVEDNVILMENTTLTVPENTILHVKKGNFYVNGTIKCKGTILVDDGGVILPFDSTEGGCDIKLEEGGTMIIRGGGKVYAGCSKGSLGTAKGTGFLTLESGSQIINFGHLCAAQIDFKAGCSVTNRTGGKIELGYEVNDKKKFLSGEVGTWYANGDPVLKMASDGQVVFRVYPYSTMNLGPQLNNHYVKMYTYSADNGKATIDEHYNIKKPATRQKSN